MSVYTYWCPMRWGDMDAQAHINNATYIDYLQEARVNFLLNGPDVMGEMLTNGVLVVSHQVEYLRPVRFGPDLLKINLWVDEVRGARFSIGYEIFDGETVAVRARTVLVPFDLAGAGLRLLSPVERDLLTEAKESFDRLRTRSTTDWRPLPRVRWSEDDLPDGDHRHRFLVRWADLDSYNHVNNVKFYDYFQEARIAMMASVTGNLGPDALSRPEAQWALVRQDVDYLKPIDFRIEPYEVRSIVSAIGTTSFQVAAEIRDPDTAEVLAAARSVVVAFDATTGTSRPLDPEAAKHLASWQPGP